MTTLPGTPPARPRLRRDADPSDPVERGVLSTLDRRRPVVRVVLLAVQVLILLGLVLASLGPLVWLAKAAVSTSQDIIRAPLELWPSGAVWANISEAWRSVRIGTYLGNTAVICAGTVVVSLVTCSTGAYVLSVCRPRWGPVVYAAVLATLFIPGVISLVPLYLTVLDLPLTGWSLQNNYWGLWLPAAANAFNVVVMKRFFDGLPRDTMDSARIDGAGTLRVFIHIVVPMSRPILGVIALLTAIAAYKDFLWPLLVIDDFDLQPISVALPRVEQNTPISLQMAALFLTTIVPIALFLIFQRQFLRGVGQAGSLKG